MLKEKSASYAFFFLVVVIGILSPNEKIQTDDFHHIAKKKQKTKIKS